MNLEQKRNFTDTLMQVVLMLMIVVLVLLIPILVFMWRSPGVPPTPAPSATPTPAVTATPTPKPAARIVYETDAANYEYDKELARRFSQETGIAVDVVPFTGSSDENYRRYQDLFEGQSPTFDVLLMDVVWGGAFAQHLVDLQPALGREASAHYPGLIENNTISGRLIAMPLFGDIGVLYYRQDLLKKYGFSAPPTTWQELTDMAQKIQDGERAAGRPNFTGFVFQGKPYEGLTCNALEWIVSSGGNIVENGKVAINSPQAAQALALAQKWPETISRGVTGYGETETLDLFRAGDAAFMRNWPYAYALASATDSPVKDLFAVAPLPAAAGHQPVGTVGGGQLGVSIYSRNQEAAIAFVRFMTSPEAQTWRAKTASFVPTIPEVARDPEVLTAMPFLKDIVDVLRVARPSGIARQNYDRVSSVISRGVGQILNGEDVTQGLSRMEVDLRRELQGGT
jgi:trehalose/maltose transport system substrate-binding protein